jgi:SAM-dependent methyltransferase
MHVATALFREYVFTTFRYIPPKMVGANRSSSQALHHLFAKCVGVDLAEGMVNEYRATIAELGAGEGHMIGVRGNLVTASVEPTNPPLSDEELNGFDLVVICMTLHHIEDVELATKRLAERLRPGGVLLVIDWAQQDGSSRASGLEAVDHGHPAAPTIAHHSFSKEQMFSLFEKAGCGESRFEVADGLTRLPMDGAVLEMQMFWARATKL